MKKIDEVINEVSFVFFNNYFSYKDFVELSNAYFSYKEIKKYLFEIKFESAFGSAKFIVNIKDYKIEYYNYICSLYLNERYFYNEICSLDNNK